jgi:uncharacterized membrane protein
MDTTQRPKRIVVIDGMGGGIGVQLIGKLKELLSGALKPKCAGVEIIALGTNAVAVERMVKAGAARGATGENAIVQSAALGDIILGPIGIIIGNSMMGEITPAMAAAILAAHARRILLPLQNEHFSLAVTENVPLARMVEKAIEMVKTILDE